MSSEKKKSTWNLGTFAALASIVSVPIAIGLWYFTGSESGGDTLRTAGDGSPIVDAGRDATLGTTAEAVTPKPATSPPDERGESAPNVPPAASSYATGGDNSPIVRAGRDAHVHLGAKANDEITSKHTAEENLALAKRYYEGEGQPVNYALARKHATASAEQGNPGAVTLLASWYAKGDVFERDGLAAQRLYKEAFRMGDAKAACVVGEMLEAPLNSVVSGDGSGKPPLFVQFGLHEPLHWYIQSYRAGYKPALERITQRAWTETTLEMLERDYPESLRYLKEKLGDEVQVVPPPLDPETFRSNLEASAAPKKQNPWRQANDQENREWDAGWRKESSPPAPR